MFQDSSHCFTSPPSHKRISTISSIQGFPHREPPLRIWVIQLWSRQLLSSNNTTSTQKARHNNYHLYTQRDGHLTKQQSTSQQRDRALSQPIITSYQRDKAQSQHSNNHLYTQRDNNQLKHNLQNHLYTRGIPTNTRKVTTLGGLNNHKPVFPQKQDPIDSIDMIAQVLENKELGNQNHKENTWENF